MPAAAVIPALIAYIKVVAVKKLVVGFRRALRLSAVKVCTVWVTPHCRILTAVLNWVAVKGGVHGGNSVHISGVPTLLL